MQEIRKYVKKYIKYLILGPFFKLLEALFELFLPLLMARMMRYALQGENGGGRWQDHEVIGFGLLLLAVILLGFAFSFTCQWMAAKCSQGVGTDLRAAVFQKLHRLHPDQLQLIGQPRLRGVQTSDMQAVQLAVAFVIRLLIRAPFVCLGAILMSFYIQPTLAWALFAVVPVFSFVLYFNMFRAVDLLRSIQAQKDELLQKITDNFNGMRVIRAYLGEEKEKQDFAELNVQMTEEAIRYEMRLQDVSVWLVVLLYGAQLAILAFADYFLGTNLLSRADLIALLSYVNQVLIAMKVIANLAIVFPQGWAAAERIESVLVYPEPVDSVEPVEPVEPVKPVEPVAQVAASLTLTEDRAGASTLSAAPIVVGSGLEVQDLSYTYPQAKLPAIKGVSFALKRGKVLGIIGGTGSGKSTLCRILAGQMEVSVGKIVWEGRELCDRERAALVGFASQEAVLFTGSLAENICPPDKELAGKTIQLALDTARVSSFLQWPEDKEKQIEQFGMNFSGGQRQRLTIARALLREPKLCILDDVQSGLDFYTAGQMRHALRANYPQMTFIISTQRIEQIWQADHILVLEDGRISAQGKAEDLLKTSTIFRQLYEIQFGGKKHG